MSSHRRKALHLPVMAALLVFLLSACTMRASFDTKVNADGSGNVTAVVAFDSEFRELIESESPEPIDWTDPESLSGTDSPTGLTPELPEGVTVTPYEDGDFLGFAASKEFADLEEMEQVLAEMTDSEGDDAFTVTSEDGTITFQTNTSVFSQDEVLSEADAEFLPPEALANLFDVSFTLDLPGEVTEHNADEVTDEGVLVWRFNPAATDAPMPAAVATISGSFPTFLVIGVLAVIAAAAAAYVLVRRRQDGTVSDDGEEVLVGDEAPGPADPVS